MNYPPRFELSFLAPRYWGMWLLFGLLYAAMFLPRKTLMALGARLGDLMWRRDKKRRHIVEVNLRMCFPRLSDAEQAQLARAHFQSYARSLLDMGLALWGSQKRIRRVTQIDGGERVKELQTQGGVLLLSYHFTTLEIFGTIVGQLGHSMSVMNRDNNALLTWQQYRARTRFGGALMAMRAHGLRAVIKCLKDGRACLYVSDEDFGKSKQGARHSVFADFFGVKRATLDTFARIAQKTGAPVIPCACLLDETSGRYRAIFNQALQDFPSGDAVADAARLHRAMQELIEQAPQQYMWRFRWFRTRPDGLPSPY